MTTTQPMPKFEGRSVDAATLAFSGTPDNEPLRPMHLGESGVMVVRYHVKNVAHKTAAGATMKRVHSLEVQAAFEMDGRDGEDLLESLHRGYAAATGENVLPLPLEDDDAEFGQADDVDGEFDLPSDEDADEADALIDAALEGDTDDE